MRAVNIDVDVRVAAGADGPLGMAATAWLPDAVPEHPLVMFALPGGGYGRHYFDLHLPGHAGYSQAEHHTTRGAVLVGVDHLGVGDSSVELNGTATVEDLAAAADAAVREILDRFRAGTLAPDIPAREPGLVVGIGQSMGGGITLLMQGRHQTYDAVAALGYSAIQTVLPMKDLEMRGFVKEVFRGLSRKTPPTELAVPEFGDQIPDYLYPFFWEDVPEDVVKADIAGGYPTRSDAPPWGSNTMPNCTVAMMAPGFAAEEAAAVDVPVFMGFGERDTSENPNAEPGAFDRSRDITVHVVPQTAHMHNFGSGRRILWDRLLSWAKGLLTCRMHA